MNYKINAVFFSEKEASTAARLLQKAGYRKEFLGYTQNANIRPESLVEDHLINENSITVFTPNINRAFKARNILSKIGALSTKMKLDFPETILIEETKLTLKNMMTGFHKKLLVYSPETIERKKLKKI